MRNFVLVGLTLGLVAACGGGDERSFITDDAGAGATGASGASGTGASAGSGGSAGASGGSAGSSGGSAGATGGSAGATGGSAGATGGSAGATGGTAGASGGSAGAGGSGGGITCDTVKNVCAPDPVAGWVGPVAFHSGASTLPACPASYATKVGDGMSGLTPGSASCKCSCDPAIKISCKGGAVIYDVPDGGLKCPLDPTIYPKVWSANAGTCTPPALNTTGKVTVVLPQPNDVGGCAPKPAHNLPTPKWAEQTRVCKGGTPATGSCAKGQTCMPQPGAVYDLCVYQPGVVACPAAYPVKNRFYEGLTDSRACSACSCGKATSSCGGSVRFTSACSGTPALYSTVTPCSTPNINIKTSQFGTYVPAPTGNCPASASTLTGTVTPKGEVTVCCLP